MYAAPSGAVTLWATAHNGEKAWEERGSENGPRKETAMAREGVAAGSVRYSIRFSAFRRLRSEGTSEYRTGSLIVIMASPREPEVGQRGGNPTREPRLWSWFLALVRANTS